MKKKVVLAYSGGLDTSVILHLPSPLGSAASYGVNVPIDRQYVADLLGFEKVQNNVLYVGNSRGKFESIVLSALAQIMGDLGKLASDLIIFSTPEFGYVTLPQELCSGSSLMPQKRNPDCLELVSHQDPVKNIQAKTHLGAPGNLGIDLSMKTIDELQQWVDQTSKFQAIWYTKLIKTGLIRPE